MFPTRSTGYFPVAVSLREREPGRAVIRHKGAVLVIVMIVLIIMTVLGVAAIRNTLLEEKMAGNMLDRDMAFQAAESALRAAEKYIELNIISTLTFDTDGTDGFYDNTDDRLWAHIDWDANDSREYAGFDSSYNVGTPPRYIVQHLTTTGSATEELNQDNYGQGTGAGVVAVFLITARGTGGSESAVVYLQSTYGKRL
jgi:type IV pilus assembly protein PilX